MMYVRAHAISTSEMISTMGTGTEGKERGNTKKKRFYIKINGATLAYIFCWELWVLRWFRGWVFL
jgi:hypothetical protein